MDLDGPLGCAESRRNLFVEHPGDYAFEHVKLTWCERSQPITRLFVLRMLKPLLGRALESPLHRRQEIFVLEGYGRNRLRSATFHETLKWRLKNLPSRLDNKCVM